MKMEDYIRELEDMQARKIVKLEKSPPCWCPVCRENVSEEDIEPFMDLVHSKTHEYRNVLRKKEEEARLREARWKAEREMESEDTNGEAIQVVTSISSIFDT